MTVWSHAARNISEGYSNAGGYDTKGCGSLGVLKGICNQNVNFVILNSNSQWLSYSRTEEYSTQQNDRLRFVCEFAFLVTIEY